VSKRKTRDRQLAKLAARRAAERRRQRRKRIVAAAVALALALGGGTLAFVAFTGTSAPPLPVACGGSTPKEADTVSSFNEKYSQPPKMTIDTSKTYVATMKTSCGTIEMELDPKSAPNTVNSLVFLAGEHYFDGSTFHRIVKGFVIQGGDPSGTGMGGPGYSTVDPPGNGAQYPVGTVAMAKGGPEPAGTAGSQFFIVTSPNAQTSLAPQGVGQYAIVGHVVSGLDAVKKIEAIPTVAHDAPTERVFIESFRIREK
jgi:cyclophilin family peptidyl-prolyl cis-trans isomerase